MALIEFSFYSKSLMRTVSAKAIIPFDGAKGIQERYKTIYVLHGLTESSQAWLLSTNIYEIAQQKGFAAVFPNGENSFYTDQAGTDYPFGKYIGEDLIEASRALFPLSTRKEDTYVIGESMGGYGAIRCGFEYKDIFGTIGAFSPALITRWVLNEAWQKSRKPFHEWTVFGDREKISGSKSDPWHLVDKIAEKCPEKFPNVFLCCGTDDELLYPTRDLKEYIENKGFSVEYFEGPGGHDYVFWRVMLNRFLDWANFSD